MNNNEQPKETDIASIYQNQTPVIQNKKKSKKKIPLIPIISIIIIIGIIIGFIFLLLNIKPTIKEITITNYDQGTATFTIVLNSANGDYDCYISDHKTNDFYDKKHTSTSDGTCIFSDASIKDYYIYVKKSGSDDINEFQLSNYYKKTIDINVNKDKVYLGIGEEDTIIPRVIAIDHNLDKVEWKMQDPNIASIKDGLITGLSLGETTLIIETPDGFQKEIKIIVTDLISSPIINNTRAFLTCRQYTNDQAELLDEILKSKIASVGYKTRAGVVEAARFLTLRLPYRVNYFIETGRLNNYDKIAFVDGEGRFYHQGMYLSEEKFSNIQASKNGPAIWGCPLTQDNGLVRENGFDCSGFVTWVLYNGGFDVKDTGAGYTQRNDDVADLGEFHDITLELLRSGKVKAGDLIGSNGHAAIIAGIDDDHIYIAESLVYNTGITMLTYGYEELAASSKFTYLSLMDSVYKTDGDYTNIW